MRKVKIGVVEDEMIIARNLQSILSNLGYEVCKPCINYEQGVEMLQSEKPDIVILDIQLKGEKDGVDLAWYIRENINIPFIFLTANADKMTIDKAKKVNPPSYIVKPFKKDDLYTAIEMALYNFGRHNLIDAEHQNITIWDGLFIKTREYHMKVPFNDILYLKSDHVYVEMKLRTGETINVRGSLDNIAQQLLPHISLIRTHRSYMVNLSKLTKMTIDNLYLEGCSDEIPISKTYKSKIQEKMNFLT